MRESILEQRHRQLKEKYPDCLILYRVGDFIEAMGADAEKLAACLSLPLTTSTNGKPLSGFKYSELNANLPKILKTGRIALCEQIEK